MISKLLGYTALLLLNCFSFVIALIKIIHKVHLDPENFEIHGYNTYAMWLGLFCAILMAICVNREYNKLHDDKGD